MKDKFEQTTKDQIQFFKLKGKVQFGQTDYFKTALLENLDQNARAFVFDLTKVQAIDSTGMGLLVTFLKHVEQDRPNIYLIINDDFIKELFEIAKLDQLFSLQTTEENVIKDIKEKGV
ncbi:STAS domain-containing protein [Bacillus suaedae]|uniref:STAS domain-containing protein n=1 Tax=Halalkalibacter suaedae TaxID=2822140 RepID=A0A940WR09_9BACI|nr:STAS domain-containing protein [Bacillus suaedae]MBP3950746.1 STAS domain-containing protein [Bacillus suaedae]